MPSQSSPLGGFFHGLFVGRYAELEDFTEWLKHVSGKQLLLLTGPVGSGKSWLLTRLYLSLHDVQFVLWLDLTPGAVHPSTQMSIIDLGVPEKRQQWFVDMVAEAERVVAEHIIDYDHTVSFVMMLNGFLTKLVKQLPLRGITAAPLLIVDGFEDLKTDLRDFVEDQLVDGFLHHKQIRVLVASRYEDPFVHPYLRMSTQVMSLAGLSEIDIQRQIQQLASVVNRLIHLLIASQNSTSLSDAEQKEREALSQLLFNGLPSSIGVDSISRLTDTDVQRAIDTIQPYLTGIPFTNVLLFIRAALAAGQVQAQDLWDCVAACCIRAGLGEQETKFLFDLANKLPESWTQFQLKEAGFRLMDDERLVNLYQAGIIYVQNETFRYAITPHLYQLIKHYYNLRDGMTHQ